MRLILLTALTALFFVGCNEIKEEDNIPTSKVELLTMLEDTEEEKKEQKDSSEANGKILLIGRGSEPGWTAEFYSDRVKLSLDYGEINEEIAYDFSNVTNEKGFTLNLSNFKSINGKKEIKKLSVVIEKESCKEESTGSLKDRKITLSFNGKTYKGCAGN